MGYLPITIYNRTFKKLLFGFHPLVWKFYTVLILKKNRKEMEGNFFFVFFVVNEILIRLALNLFTSHFVSHF